MKRRLFFIFLLIFTAVNSCYAKDSTLVFKVAAGINYNHPVFERNYNHSYYQHFASSSTSLINQDTSSFSPIINIGVQKMICKNFGFSLQFSYNYSKLDYTVYTTSNVYPPAPFPHSSASGQTHYIITPHNFVGSFGPVFYFKQLYIIPKFDLSYLTYVSIIHETNTNIDSAGVAATTQNSTKVKDGKFTGGGGLSIGYNFKIKKSFLFIELQTDYYDQPRNFHSRNGFNTSFTIGIGL